MEQCVCLELWVKASKELLVATCQSRFESRTRRRASQCSQSCLGQRVEDHDVKSSQPVRTSGSPERPSRRGYRRAAAAAGCSRLADCSSCPKKMAAAPAPV